MSSSLSRDRVELEGGAFVRSLSPHQGRERAGARGKYLSKKTPDLSSRANRNRRHLIEPLVVRVVAAAVVARVAPARVVPARVAGATSRLAAARLAGGRGLRVSLLLRDDIARELVRLGSGSGSGSG